ncbi:MAG: hypothetical protein K2G41_07915 [Duncaniella sp.]|uniref:PKD-like family lipoprotein n=1 Tax=Duncaniella sp. TaxID=2518496 RepID=UPI0023D70E80|nr:PKD-like family lipoprotein [Duncaniella sp.]MDE6090616.1 hypothetical protein [Duncaniella sp.]
MKKIYMLPLLALCLSACVDDEGNYKYSDLNEVTIENFESRYSAISQVDRIQISPEVSSTLYGEDTSDMEFTWSVCLDNLSHEHIVLSHEKDLDWLVDIDPGSYNLYFTVRSKSEGVEDLFQASLTVSSPLTTGFLVLGDLVSDNRCAVDMIAMPTGRDTMVVEDVYDNSQLRLQNPEKIIFAGYHYSGAEGHRQALWMLADNKARRMTSGSSFEDLGEFNDLALVEVDYPVTKPAVMRDMFPHQSVISGRAQNLSQMYRGYVTDEVVVVASVMMLEYFTEPCNRYERNSSSPLFKPSPYVFYRAAYNSAYSTCLIYNMDDDCFAYVNYSEYNSTKLKDSETDPWKFDARSEGRKLVYGENTFSNVSYALMTDSDDNYYIYGFTAPTSATGTAAKQALVTVDKSIATDFDKASNYMFSATRTSVFYTVGSRLYQYDWARKMIEHVDFDGEITMLKPDYLSTGSNYYFLVATYSDEGEGMIYKMERSDDPNSLTMTNLLKWPSRLKVKDMEWKNAN